MMSNLRLLYIAVILALCLAVIGCEQPQSMTDLDLGPQLDTLGQHRSLALDGPVLGYLKESHPETSGYDWFHDRNDRRPAVQSGYSSPVIERSSTYTRDYQYGAHGRSYDHYQSTTYRSEHRQGVR